METSLLGTVTTSGCPVCGLGEGGKLYSNDFCFILCPLLISLTAKRQKKKDRKQLLLMFSSSLMTQTS